MDTPDLLPALTFALQIKKSQQAPRQSPAFTKAAYLVSALAENGGTPAVVRLAQERPLMLALLSLVLSGGGRGGNYKEAEDALIPLVNITKETPLVPVEETAEAMAVVMRNKSGEKGAATIVERAAIVMNNLLVFRGRSVATKVAHARGMLPALFAVLKADAGAASKHVAFCLRALGEYPELIPLTAGDSTAVAALVEAVASSNSGVAELAASALRNVCFSTLQLAQRVVDAGAIMSLFDIS